MKSCFDNGDYGDTTVVTDRSVYLISNTKEFCKQSVVQAMDKIKETYYNLSQANDLTSNSLDMFK